MNQELTEFLSQQEVSIPPLGVRLRRARNALLGRNVQGQAAQDYYSIGDLKMRWRCSRGTVYNWLRAVGAKVLDFAPPGKKGRKLVPASTVREIETRKTKRLC